MRTALFFFALAMITATATAAAEPPRTCTYTSWSGKKARVTKPYDKVTAQERDPESSCTVCEEDQIWIEMADVPRFRICRFFVEDVRKALSEALTRGARIESVSGYRIDYARNNAKKRTLSFHSFGTAIDINPSDNGHYANCKKFGAHCQLIGGGPWNPKKNKQSITKKSAVYKAFDKIDWAWGGQLRGDHKDYMHFSPSGR